MFDAYHMLKVVRNMLDSFKVITSMGGKISWPYIRDIQAVQVSIRIYIYRWNFDVVSVPWKGVLHIVLCYEYS